MIRLLFALLIVQAVSCHSPRELKRYVKRNTSVIRTIEPDSLNFSDLEALGKAIGNSRIVMLGEATHGDAYTFAAKTRIIKYLHEKMGFDVLAFESDFYALNTKWDLLSEGKLKYDSSFLTSNVHGVWPTCHTCNNLFYDYIPATLNTASPIIVTGFDNQVFGAYSYRKFTKHLDSYLISKSIPFTDNEIYNTFFLKQIDSIIMGNIDSLRLEAV